jgi:hypothetical protein
MKPQVTSTTSIPLSLPLFLAAQRSRRLRRTRLGKIVRFLLTGDWITCERAHAEFGICCLQGYIGRAKKIGLPIVKAEYPSTDEFGRFRWRAKYRVTNEAICDIAAGLTKLD